MLINLTCVQKKVGSNSIDEAIGYLEALIASLSYAENRIVLLPEVWVSGFDRDKLFYFAKKSDELLDRLKILSNSTLVSIAGTIPMFTNINSKKLYNSFIFFSSQGKLVANYRKIHLFPLISEQKYFLSGENPVMLRLNGIKIGFATCYDIRFPELFRYYALHGVDIVLVAACFLEPKLNDWKILLQARAIENQIFISGVNAVGEETVDAQKLVYLGHSMVISPNGKILVELDKNETTSTILIDTNEIVQARSRINFLNDIVDDYSIRRKRDNLYLSSKDRLPS